MIALSFEPQPVVQDLYDLANAEGGAVIRCRQNAFRN